MKNANGNRFFTGYRLTGYLLTTLIGILLLLLTYPDSSVNWHQKCCRFLLITRLPSAIPHQAQIAIHQLRFNRVNYRAFYKAFIGWISFPQLPTLWHICFCHVQGGKQTVGVILMNPEMLQMCSSTTQACWNFLSLQGICLPI